MPFYSSNQPEITMFMTIGFLVYNRSNILKFQTDKDLSCFLENQQTINTGKFTKIYTKLHEDYYGLVRYTFKQVDFALGDYIKYGGYPRESVKMLQGRRKLQTQQYRKTMDQLRYNEEIENQMTKMAIDAKRQARREGIQAQAYIYHSEKQDYPTKCQPISQNRTSEKFDGEATGINKKQLGEEGGAERICRSQTAIWSRRKIAMFSRLRLI